AWGKGENKGCGNCNCQKPNFNIDTLSPGDWLKWEIDRIFRGVKQKKSIIGTGRQFCHRIKRFTEGNPV
ncbi:MAG: hypothetical protein RI965_1933, partial [Bacteroidota bacterium]